MQDRDEFGGFAFGLLIGGLAGGVTALLLAPQSGEDTRALIKDRSIELRDKAQERTAEALARIEATSKEAFARVEDVGLQLTGLGQNAAETVEIEVADKLDV